MEKKRTETGAKAYQRADAEWRIKPYSDRHRTLSKDLSMLDVDFVEWRYRNSELVPVGVMEVTRVDVGREVNQEYLDAIVQRCEQRDLQTLVARKVAAALQTKAHIILFRADCSVFWVYNLTNRGGWWHLNPTQYGRVLAKIIVDQYS